jgi:hypothetical protein
MITLITIFVPEQTVVFKKGALISKGKEQTKIAVNKISVLFGRVKIKLSDGEIIVYNGIPFIYTITKKDGSKSKRK